jgi:hypothetical protein
MVRWVEVFVVVIIIFFPSAVVTAKGPAQDAINAVDALGYAPFDRRKKIARIREGIPPGLDCTLSCTFVNNWNLLAFGRTRGNEASCGSSKQQYGLPHDVVLFCTIQQWFAQFCWRSTTPTKMSSSV